MGARFDLAGILKRLFRRPRREPRPSQAAKRYHSVSIRPGRVACTHANALLDERFLAGQAPRLPLQGCDQEVCSCTFAHYEDRRHEVRRAEDGDGRPRRYEARNSRLGTGRRRADHDTSFDDQYFEYVSERGADDDRS